MISPEVDIVTTFIRMHPSAVAREIELYSPQMAANLLLALPSNYTSAVIASMLPVYIARLVNFIDKERLTALLSNLDYQFITMVLRALHPDQREPLLKLLPDKISTYCRLLLRYTANTIGAIMHADILLLPINISVEDALVRYDDHEGSDNSDFILVVDEKIKLLGTVSIRGLRSAHQDEKLSNILSDSIPTIFSRSTHAAARNHAGWLSSDILAVENRFDQIIGIIRHMDLRANDALLPAVEEQQEPGILESLTSAYLQSVSATLELLYPTSESDSESRAEKV